MSVRTRIAPSPTGEDLHIGNIYTGLMNWAYARKKSGKFIIRIEDTDRTRYIEGSEARILSSLHKFGLNYDEGPDIGGPYAPYRQSERLELYKKYAEELVKKGHAYYCFCTKERLDALRAEQSVTKQPTHYDRFCLNNEKVPEEKIKKGEKYVIRMKIPDNRDIVFEDVLRGEVKINSDQLDDQVLLKSDGFPTYHLGVVVDDHAMEITHVIRAEEWISSTPKHILLYEFFGWEIPIFAHLPLLRNADKSKLSKRKNPVWASWYLENGYLPEAILNFLALLGWSHPQEKEIFSMDEFTKLFDLSDLHPVGPVFDITKLTWMNGVYIREKSNQELIGLLKDFYKDDKSLEVIFENPNVEKIIELAKTRMTTLLDFKNLVIKLPSEKKQDAKVIESLSKKLGEIKVWEKDDIFAGLKEILDEYEVRMPVLYEILTGQQKGLPLPDFLEALGQTESLERLSK